MQNLDPEQLHRSSLYKEAWNEWMTEFQETHRGRFPLPAEVAQALDSEIGPKFRKYFGEEEGQWLLDRWRKEIEEVQQAYQAEMDRIAREAGWRG